MKIAMEMLTFNRLEFTKIVLENYFKTTKIEHKLLVWDNYSTDGTREWLEQVAKKKYPLKVHFSKQNVGVPQAIRGFLSHPFVADADLVGKIDNDILVCDDWLESFAEAMEKIPELTVVAAYNETNPPKSFRDYNGVFIAPSLHGMQGSLWLARRSTFNRFPFAENGYAGNWIYFGRLGAKYKQLLGYHRKVHYQTDARQWGRGSPFPDFDYRDYYAKIAAYRSHKHILPSSKSAGKPQKQKPKITRGRQMAKTLLILTTAGRLHWLKQAIESLQDAIDVLVVDDATPEKIGIRNFCKQEKIQFITKPEPKGLTDSWNIGYRYFVKHGYIYCILSNDDVRFARGFSVEIKHALNAKFSLVGPITNEPGPALHQGIKKFIRAKRDWSKVDEIREVLVGKFRHDRFQPSTEVNGFCFAFSNAIRQFEFASGNLFNPANINVDNEYDLAKRIRGNSGRIAICRTAYVFHKKMGTYKELGWQTIPGHRNRLWTYSKDEVKQNENLPIEDNKPKEEELNIKNLPLSQYIDWLHEGKFFYLPRYGNSEWGSILEGKHLYSQTEFFPEIQNDLKRSLVENRKSPVIFGMQNYAMRLFGKEIKNFLEQNDLLESTWVNADVFHYASRDGLLFPLIRELQSKKVIIIGPHFLKRLSEQTFEYLEFIEIPVQDSYKIKSKISTAILEANSKFGDGIIYAFSAGAVSNIFISELWRQMPKNFLIDFGSLWDIFCGIRSRGYMYKNVYKEAKLRKNLGEE